ncbi:MAG: DUF4922 domain-containing protein, partial [Chitinispirillia bacterium]
MFTIENSAKLSLADLMVQLYGQQYQSWPLLKKNYDALLKVKTRKMRCNDHTVNIQWNPERITSSTAKIDKQGIES